MYGLLIPFIGSLLGLWQAASAPPDATFDTGRAVGFWCIGPLLILLIVFAFYRRSKKKPKP